MRGEFWVVNDEGWVIRGEWWRVSDEGEWWRVSDDGGLRQGIVVRIDPSRNDHKWHVLHELWTFYYSIIYIILKEFFTFKPSESQENNFLCPKWKFIKIHLDLMNIVSQKINIFSLKKIIDFLQKWQNIAQILISCFVKLQNFCPNFDFVYREISRNSSKISRNTKLNILRNVREITKTKFFCSYPS